MKKFGLFLILSLGLFGSEFEGEMKNYDEVFVKIKEQRKGLNSGEISSLQDPFKLNLPVAPKGDQNTTKYSSARGFMLKANEKQELTLKNGSKNVGIKIK